MKEVAWQDKGGCRDEACANCKKRDNTFNPLSSGNAMQRSGMEWATEAGNTAYFCAFKNRHFKNRLCWFGASFCFAQAEEHLITCGGGVENLFSNAEKNYSLLFIKSNSSAISLVNLDNGRFSSVAKSNSFPKANK